MHTYNIGYHIYEESEHIQLYHQRKFNDEEFDSIVMKAVVNVLDKQEVKEDEKISFQDILYDVTEELIKNFGFKEVKFNSEFSVFGWADILNKEDWKDIRDEKLNKLTEYIKAQKEKG